MEPVQKQPDSAVDEGQPRDGDDDSKSRKLPPVQSAIPGDTNDQPITPAPTADDQSGEPVDDAVVDESETLSFDSYQDWYANAPDEVKQIVDDEIANLRSALDKERSERKELSKRLGELEKAAGKNTELQSQLNKLKGEVDTSIEMTGFYEEAHRNRALDLELAWLAYSKRRDELTKKGKVDWDAFKDMYPNLFARPVSAQTPAGGGDTHAGSGQDEINLQRTRQPAGMNSMIRSAAGRQ